MEPLAREHGWVDTIGGGFTGPESFEIPVALLPEPIVSHLKVLDRRRRFEEPGSVREAGHDYRLRTDTVRGFIEERCEFVPDARTTETQLYEDYFAWCQKSGRHPLGKARFREHIGDVYSVVEWRKKYAGYPIWFGIRPAGP